VNGVICEVQLHLGAIVLHKEESHKFYEHYRTYFGGNVDACRKLVEMLEKCIDPDADVQAMLEKMLKGEDEELVSDMNDLALVLGDYYLRELLCRRLCELKPESLAYKNHLANAVADQGNYAEAEKLHRECLEAKKKTLGETHPDTLMSLNNLANAVADQGNYAEAEKLYRECLEGMLKTLGENHPWIKVVKRGLEDTLEKMKN
jgi:tetratricopeptide (TPR) repeat protein